MKQLTRLWFACAVLALLCAAPAFAQVVFDAASNTPTATASIANPILVTWNHTVGLSKKPYLVVSVSLDLNGGAATVGTVTYGSEAGGPNQPMTFLGVALNGTVDRAELWGLPNPIPGTHTIQVSVTNGGGQNVVVIAGAKSFFNVLETAATGTVAFATGTSLTPSVAVTNSAFAYVVDAVSYNNNVALTPGASQTNSYNVISGAPAPVFSGAGSAKTGVANTTMSWTATGTAQGWAEVAVPLQSATPQVLFDAASSAAGVVSTANPIVVTWNHTTTTAANRYLVVQVAIRLAGGTYGVPPGGNVNTTSVTYGAQPMTLLGGATRGTNVRAELWGLPAPASGTQTITVTIANTTAGRNLAVTCGAQSFSGVDQSGPTGTLAPANNNNATPTVAVTNSAYDYVVDVVGFQTNIALTAGAQQDQRWNTITGGQNFSGGSSGARGYANVTMSWTQTGGGQNWAIAAIPLHPISILLTKTASADVIKLGDSVTYTLTATNYSSGTLNGVTITDAMPAGANFVSQTGCSGTGPVTCTVGALASGATSASFTITVLPTSAGTITNVATVTWTGATASDSSQSVNTLTEQKVCATPGKDGAGGTLAGIKNDYWPGTGTPAAGAATMTIAARAAGGAGNTITAGDLLIVMQMQDAAFDTTNDETYGEGTGSTRATGTGSGAMTSLNNAGRWEYVVATNSVGAGGGTLNFNGGGQNGGLLYSYTSQTFATTTTEGQRTFQIIRVPQYTTATLGSTLTALAWNGATGGVLAVDVSGTITLGGATVAVDGLGFRGGGGVVLAGGAGVNTDFRTLSTNAANGSKGEGVAGTQRFVYQNGATIGAPGANTPLDTGVEGYVNGSYGRGAPANAGGGSTDGDPPANDDNSGGGGGGNGGNGGAGGNGWNCNCPSGGQGGGAISPNLTRITMGGGGGSGTTNNGSAETCVAPPTCRVNVAGDWADTDPSNGYYSSGANGGGIIIIRAMQATGTATLTANGFTAYNTGRDGSGGGGAGGSVLFSTQLGNLSGLTVQAKGGNGGNAWLTTAPGGSPGQRHGPGGGGGGGYILLSSAAASTNVSGGSNGVTTTANDPYGAQPGTPGIVQMITGNNVLPGGDGASCIITDLAVTNSAPATVQAGNNVTYTQSVSNLGAFAADSVVYMAPIPASATFQSISVPAGWTCITPAVGGSGVVTCTTPTLASGATANFSLVVNALTGTPAGYVMSETNSVSSNTPDSNPANNQATATTLVEGGSGGAPFPDMAVTIAQSTSLPTPGSNITYTGTVANLGGFTANNPTYSLTIPANTTFQSMGAPPAGWTCITPAVNGTGTISCSATSLAAGTTLTWPSIVVKVNAGATPGTTITATPSVGTSSQDPYTPNNTASVTSTVVAAGTADVAITISGSPNPLDPGEFYSYTATATNNGVSAAANVSVTIPVPAGANFRSITPPAGWSCSTPAVGASGNITCTIASLAVGASATFTPQVQVNTTTASGTTLTSNATISTTTSETITSNNSASASNLVTARTNADVAIVKTESPNPVGNGQFMTYRMAVTNNGPAIATNVTISDPLPAAVIFISANPSIGSCAGTTTISCSLGSLPVGNTQYVDLIVQANGTGTDTNTATASRTETDPVSSNDSSTATTTVLAVTLVRLRDFSATQDKDHVLLTWRTDFESDNLGFNVYRDTGGQRVKINKSLIAGTALLTKHKDDRDGNSAGHSYRYLDKLDSANSFVQYWLEDVDIAGHHTMHGPVSPVSGGIVGQPPNSTPLPGLGANGAIIDSPPGYGVVRSVALPAPTDKQVRQQLDLAADQGLKIYVTQEGWYRVTRAQMVAAGFDPGSKLKQLSLYMQGIEQPMVVNDDSIEFYGQRLDTFSTGARTYWLSPKGSANRLPVSHRKGGDPLAGSIPFTVQKLDRSIYVTFVLGTGDNVYFGPLISSEPATQQLNAGNIDTTYGGNATLEVTLQGGTDGPHPTEVDINGHNLGTASFANQEQKTFTFTVPQSWLTAGANSVTFTALGGDMDFSLGVSTKLTVQHLLRADSGAFQASLPGGRIATVGGFTSSNVRAIDVTDAAAPVELETSVAADPSGGYAASFTPAGNDARVVLAFDDSRILTPSEMATNRPSTWSDRKNGADLVIISNNAFLQAAATLPPVRQRDGISSAVIDVEDLYDELNFGIRGPEAIRSFLQNTAQWKTKPRWVLLVGDASIDPRNYMGMGAFDFVPTKLIDTALLKTVSDDWLADINGDGNPDFAIGRIPVRTPDDAALVFNKITSRGTPTGTWANSVLSVFDRPIAWDFAAAAAQANAYVPHSMALQTIDFAHSASPHSDVVGALNQGQLLVDYVGHGAVELWGLDGVFTSPDATALANGNRLPFVVAMDCLNGYFADVFSFSMAEALLEAPNGGAVAVWASSALTEPNGQQTMNTELMRQLFSGSNPTLGEAVNRAKAVVTDPDVRKSWILFGDPSMQLK